MPDRSIQIGVIGRPHGVRGLVHVTSHTVDPAALTTYGTLSDGGKRQFVVRWKGEGIAEVTEVVDGVLVKVADRTAAEKLTNVRLFINRSDLPPEDEDEFYLADLIGLRVYDRTGASLGTVSVVHDYGAGASLEIEPAGGGTPLILPFTRACVPVVDVAGGRVTVAPPDEVIITPQATDSSEPSTEDAA